MRGATVRVFIPNSSVCDIQFSMNFLGSVLSISQTTLNQKSVQNMLTHMRSWNKKSPV